MLITLAGYHTSLMAGQCDNHRVAHKRAYPGPRDPSELRVASLLQCPSLLNLKRQLLRLERAVSALETRERAEYTVSPH